MKTCESVQNRLLSGDHREEDRRHLTTCRECREFAAACSLFTSLPVKNPAFPERLSFESLRPPERTTRLGWFPALAVAAALLMVVTFHTDFFGKQDHSLALLHSNQLGEAVFFAEMNLLDEMVTLWEDSLWNASSVWIAENFETLESDIEQFTLEV